MGAALAEVAGFASAGAAEETLALLSALAGGGGAAAGVAATAAGVAGFAPDLLFQAMRGTSLGLGLAAITKCGVASGEQPGPKPVASNSVWYEPRFVLPCASCVVTSSRTWRVPARDGEQYDTR